MLHHSKSLLARWLRGEYRMTVSFRLIFSLIFVSLVTASPASAVTTYSDTSLDDSGADDGTIYVVGYGVTEANYDDDWELHSVRATTTIRSPLGRTFTLTRWQWYNASQGSSFTAIAEPTLPWDWNDAGDYLINTHHYSTCPPTELGTTSERAPYSPDTSTNDVYFGFVESAAVGSPPTVYCYYDACSDTINNRNPANNCFFHTLVDQADMHGGTCPAGFRNTYQRVRVPYVPFLSRCVRIAHVSQSINPCR